ncbi:MAG: tyrosine-protein phosphatase [Firmicutes bacterium]|nr:tyrosine-protein phosphatase [Bacillota bacterium]
MERGSRLLAFEKLNNTRDLGGIKGLGGRRIKNGRLIRSGQLYFASEEDLKALGSVVGTVVDLRTEQECMEKPDPEVPGASYMHLPAVRDLAAGMTREKKANETVIKTLGHDPQGALDYMRRVYTAFITDEHCLSCYRTFMDLLLGGPEKAVLWHCTAGKDRTGFAALVIEEILGVSREDILEDYLKSNEYLKDEVAGLLGYLQKSMGDFGKEGEEALGYLFGAHEEFLESLYAKAEEFYGSFPAFIEKALGVTKEEEERLRELYLE